MLEPQLPGVAIHTSRDAHDVLEELGAIAGSAGLRVTMRETPAEMGLWHVMFQPIFALGQDEATLSLLVDPIKPRIIMVEAVAQWSPDPPVYETYVAAIRAMTEPLLREYARASGKRIRVRVQAKDELLRPLPPVAATLFRQFCTVANRESLHPRDWVRFYRFILHCAERRVILTEEEMARHLIVGGFDEETALHVAEVGRHCLAVARLRRARLGEI